MAERSHAPKLSVDDGDIDAADSRGRSAESVRARRIDPHALDHVRILVIDDDEIIREALAEALAQYGAEVDIAPSSAAALERMRSERFDAVCSDLEMIGGSGLSLARTLRARETNGHHLPLIAVTGLVGDENEASVHQAGFDAYVAKPVDVDLLARHVRRLVEIARHPTR